MVRGWSKHYQQVWLERASDPRLPMYIRVAAAAYGRHRRNGHAPFDENELATLVGTDSTTGLIKAVDRNNLQRAIRRAVELDLLGQGSRIRCLIVPAHAVEGGYFGHIGEPCARHRGG